MAMPDDAFILAEVNKPYSAAVPATGTFPQSKSERYAWVPPQTYKQAVRLKRLSLGYSIPRFWIEFFIRGCYFNDFSLYGDARLTDGAYARVAMMGMGGNIQPQPISNFDYKVLSGGSAGATTVLGSGAITSLGVPPYEPIRSGWRVYSSGPATPPPSVQYDEGPQYLPAGGKFGPGAVTPVSFGFSVFEYMWILYGGGGSSRTLSGTARVSGEITGIRPGKEFDLFCWIFDLEFDSAEFPRIEKQIPLICSNYVYSLAKGSRK